MREFTFENFAAAKTFIDAVSEICERSTTTLNSILVGGTPWWRR